MLAKNKIVKCALFIAMQNGKLEDMCEDIWHVPTRDYQYSSVQPSFNDFLDRQKTSRGNISTAARIYLCATEPQQDFNSSENRDLDARLEHA